MSRFDDDLRHAARQLAREPLPPDALDEALEGDGQGRRRVGVLAGAATAALVAVVAFAIGSDRASPAGPSAAARPSVVASADPEVVACAASPAAASEGSLRIWFPCGAPPMEEIPVARVADASAPEERIRAAVASLLAGPTSDEAAVGLARAVRTEAPAQLIGDVEYHEDGLARVGFTPALEDVPNLSTTGAGGTFLRTLQATVLDLPEVTAVEFAIDGSCDRFFAFFGGACQVAADPLPEFDCPIIEPAELPSGAPPTAMRRHASADAVVWGSGEDTVVEHFGDPSAGYEAGTPVRVRGHEGWVREGGDEPLPVPVEIVWQEQGCLYALVVRLPDGEEAAVDYARRIGADVAAPPSLPPATAVRHELTSDGVTLTVELDRDTTVAGVPILATATVRNVGSDALYWGHSGTCAHPAQLEVIPTEVPEFDSGRDWTGELGLLKSVMVETEWLASPVYRFLPVRWMGVDGMACTSDLVISELAAGAELRSELGWEAIGVHGLPPPPGTYTVRASFGYMSRGVPPAGDVGPELDEYGVAMEFAVEVVGGDGGSLSPGVAFDALLADDAYVRLLADHPREEWAASTLELDGTRWVATLYLDPSDTSAAPTIVGEVDAVTGEVIDVRMDEGSRRPGG